MRKLHQLLLAGIITCIPSLLTSQVALNGTAWIAPYSGLQPELIEGVSALPASNTPLVRHIHLARNNILVITIDEGTVINQGIIPYEAMKGDSLIWGDYHGQSKYLYRQDKAHAYFLGYENAWIRPYNSFSGKKLNTEGIVLPGNITISSPDDPSYKEPRNPIAIHRKSYPIAKTHCAVRQDYSMRHEIYCELPEAFQNFNQYEIRVSDDAALQQTLHLKFSDRELRSEAIHVNLHGYQSDGPKQALLSTWMGDGGALRFDQLPEFSLINTLTGESVFNGKCKKRLAADEVEYTLKQKEFNHQLSDILLLDFTDFTKAGNYRLQVDGIGTSFEFKIDDKCMEETARLLMKGFLHQRSGIELGPPYTDYLRPRNAHPADGFKVYKCDTALFFHPPGEISNSTQSSIFQRIQASILEDSLVEEAWGGWMDAGDFDQRMTHYTSVRRMMYLYEMNPEYFENIDFGIPESDNNIPDILDEACWVLDLQKRTQGRYEVGGISWWVESIEHPRAGEPSWLHSLPTALVPPTPRASMNYAAAAANMAFLLRKYDNELAKSYEASALAAMEWADNNQDTPDLFGSYPRPVTEAMACIQLYRCTGKAKWHKRIKMLLEEAFPHGILNDANAPTVEVFLNYLFLDEKMTDGDLRETARAALLKVADGLLEGASKNTQQVLNYSNTELNRLATFGRKALPVAAAHWISGDEKYRDALTATIQYTMGCNPMNRSYISGLGERWFIPYQHDWESANLPMPSGIPNFGPTIVREDRWGWQGNWGMNEIKRAGLHPASLLDWPLPESCFNQVWMAPTNEFTVSSPMGDLLVISAYLAQYSTQKPKP